MTRPFKQEATVVATCGHPKARPLLILTGLAGIWRLRVCQDCVNRIAHVEEFYFYVNGSRWMSSLEVNARLRVGQLTITLLDA